MIKNISAVFLLVFLVFQGSFADDKRALKVLLVTGGCCHNYPLQTEAMKRALGKLIEAEWTVVSEGGNGTSATISLYNKKKWSKGYDVVIHNECFADTKDSDYIRKITSAHYKGTPAVVIHCAMHSYRSATIDDWREFLGVTSKRHDHESNYSVQKVVNDHFIFQGFPYNWTGPKDELYIIEKVWPGVQVLATSVSQRDGKTHPVMWTNQYGKARVFGTTFGHSDDTFNDEVFLTAISRGIVWAADRK